MHVYSTLSDVRVNGDIVQLPIHEFGSRADQRLSNWYQCTIPVAPVLVDWERDRVITPIQRTELAAAFPDGATWGSVEAAYMTLRVARTVWANPDDETLPRVRFLYQFCHGGKYTQRGYLETVQTALRDQLPQGDKRVLTPARLKKLATLESKASPMTSGAVAKAFSACFLGAYKKTSQTPSLAEQLFVWAPLHDAKFNEELNPELHAHFKKVMTTHKGGAGKCLSVILCEYGRTAIRQKASSWTKSPLTGGVRIGLPHKDANDYEHRNGEQYGLNHMGQILSVCAHRLFDTAIMPWHPVERHMSNLDVKVFNTEKAQVLCAITRVKRKSGGGGGATKKKAPVPETFETQVSAIAPAIRGWCKKIEEAQAAMGEAASWKFSEHLDPETAAQMRLLHTHVVRPLMAVLQGCADDVALEATEGSDRWTEIGLLDTVASGSDPDSSALSKMMSSMADIFTH